MKKQYYVDLYFRFHDHRTFFPVLSADPLSGITERQHIEIVRAAAQFEQFLSGAVFALQMRRFCKERKYGLGMMKDLSSLLIECQHTDILRFSSCQLSWDPQGGSKNKTTDP